jgi:hypothetical protein
VGKHGTSVAKEAVAQTKTTPLSGDAAGKHPTIKRLDGSTITPAGIDGTVARLLRAANVPGVGIAIINDGETAFLKAYGIRDTSWSLFRRWLELLSGIMA